MSGYAICLELRLAGGYRYYSDTALHEAATYWEPRILQLTEPTRSTDPLGGYPSVPAMTVTLDNSDGAMSEMIEMEGVDGTLALIYEKTIINKAVTETTTRFAGNCRVTGGDQASIEIEIQPAVITELDMFQRKLNITAFPNLPDGSVAGKPSTAGLGMNAVAGYATSVQGKVLLQMIDGTANAEKYAASMGGVYDITAVRRRRYDTNGVETWTTLTLTTHYTKFVYALDGEGNAYSYIKLASGVWQAGDEYYADIKGLPKEYYATTDGVNDFFSRANVSLSSDFPGKSSVTSYTFERKFRTPPSFTTATNLFAVWSIVTTQYSLKLEVDASGNILFYHKYGGFYSVAGPALVTSTTYTVRISWKAGGKLALQIAGSSYYSANTVAGLDASTAAFNVDSDSDGNRKFAGRDYYLIWAEDAQPLTGSNLSDRDQPLKDIKGEWHFCGIAQVGDAGAYYVRDRVGSNHLTATSLTQADITMVDYERTPAWVADKWLRWNDYNWQIASTRIDRASFAVVAALQEAAGWNDASGQWHAGCLPTESGSVMTTEETLRAIAWNQGANFVIGKNGRLRLVNFDVTTQADPAAADYREEWGDIVDAKMDAPLRLWNQAPRVAFDRLHRDGGDWGGSLVAENQASIDRFGLAEEDAEFGFCGHVDYATALIKRHMIRRSGGGANVVLTMCGTAAHALSVGDKVAITCRNLRGDFEQRQILLYEITDGLMNCKPILRGIEVGTQCGSVVVTAKAAGGGGDETEKIINPSLDSFIGMTQTWCGSNPFTDAHSSGNYGSYLYTRHGHFHRYGTAVCPCDGLGYDNINWRSIWRFDLSDLAGKTAISVQLRLFILSAPNFIHNYLFRECDSPLYSSNWGGSGVYRCTLTGWTEASNWGNINGGGNWNDGACIGAIMGSFGGGMGLKYIDLNAAGALAYIQAAINGTGDPGGAGTQVNLTLQGYPDGYYTDNCSIASNEHGTVNYRPALIVTYQ